MFIVNVATCGVVCVLYLLLCGFPAGRTQHRRIAALLRYFLNVHQGLNPYE